MSYEEEDFDEDPVKFREQRREKLIKRTIDAYLTSLESHRRGGEDEDARDFLVTHGIASDMFLTALKPIIAQFAKSQYHLQEEKQTLERRNEKLESKVKGLQRSLDVMKKMMDQGTPQEQEERHIIALQKARQDALERLRPE